MRLGGTSTGSSLSSLSTPEEERARSVALHRPGQDQLEARPGPGQARPRPRPADMTGPRVDTGRSKPEQTRVRSKQAKPRPRPEQARPRPEQARPRPEQTRPRPEQARPKPNQTRPGRELSKADPLAGRQTKVVQHSSECIVFPLYCTAVRQCAGKCAGCGKPLLEDGFFALGALYHRPCFRCK